MSSTPSVGAVVCALAPDGRQFRLRFDGIQDFSPAEHGLQQQFTALEQIPGFLVEHGTTYGGTLSRRGFTLCAETPVAISSTV